MKLIYRSMQEIPGKTKLILIRKAIFMLALGLSAALLGVQFCPAIVPTMVNRTPTESEVKAAYIYYFAKFVNWPSVVLAAPNDPIIIGVFGDNEFGALLESIVKNKTIREHPINIRLVKEPAEFPSCHILYISASELKRSKQIVEELRIRPILTVTEADTSSSAKGIMNLFVEAGKVQFEIDIAKAGQVHLQISSKLLRLARGAAGNRAAREE
jgi:hypothetical protein